MTEIEAAREQLREMACGVEAMRYRLLGVLASVPPSPSETDPEMEVDVTDPVAQLRGNLQILISDEIEPLIQSLLDAIGGPPKPQGRKT
jgi:hypothetical protein